MFKLIEFGVQTHRVWSGIYAKCPSRISNISLQVCVQAEPDESHPYRIRLWAVISARHVTGCTSLRLQKYRNITNKTNNLSDFYQNRLQNIICFLLFEPHCHIDPFIKKKSQSSYCGKNGFKRKYGEEFLSKKEKELLLKIKYKKKDNRPYGELARTYTHVRKILRVHLFYELQRTLESRQKVFVFKKKQ